MKKVLSILFIAILTITTAVAQDVDEIINNYFKNIGGKANWEKVDNMVIIGKMSMQDMELQMTRYSQKPNLEYVKIDVMGKTLIQAFDGENSWSINPFQGGETAQKGTEEESKEARKEMFENDFLNYEEKGSTVKLLGKEDVEGTECFKILLTKKDGDEATYFFDTENYVPIMLETAISEGPMKGKVAQSYFSDYMEVGDLMMAHFMESKVDGQTLQKMTFESIEVNVKIDASKFKMPK